MTLKEKAEAAIIYDKVKLVFPTISNVTSKKLTPAVVKPELDRITLPHTPPIGVTLSYIKLLKDVIKTENNVDERKLTVTTQKTTILSNLPKNNYHSFRTSK